MLLVIAIIFLGITGWVSYFLSASVYKSLKKNDHPYARAIQAVVFLLSFVALITLGIYLVATNVRMER